MKKLFILISLFLVLFSGCKKRENQHVNEKPSYPILEEIVKGIPTITNPDYPRDGRFNIDLIEEISIGGENLPKEAILNRPFDIGVDSQENFYILDWGDINIKKFDSSGNFIKTIGRQGEGPGEFSRPPLKFCITDNDEILIRDMVSRQIMFLDQNGTYISGFKTKGQGMEIECDSIGGSSPYSYQFVWTVSKDGKIYSGYSENYMLHVYDSKGNLRFKFGRKYIPKKNKYWKEGNMSSKLSPAFDRFIFFDDENNLWLQQYTPEDHPGFVYDIFSSEGIYIKQITLSHKISMIKNGKTYAITRDENDQSFIKRFKINL